MKASGDYIVHDYISETPAVLMLSSSCLHHVHVRTEKLCMQRSLQIIIDRSSGAFVQQMLSPQRDRTETRGPGALTQTQAELTIVLQWFSQVNLNTLFLSGISRILFSSINLKRKDRHLTSARYHNNTRYMEPILKESLVPIMIYGLLSQVVFGWQVQLHLNMKPYAKETWSFKTGSLSWQWSLKTGFTILM